MVTTPSMARSMVCAMFLFALSMSCVAITASAQPASISDNCDGFTEETRPVLRKAPFDDGYRSFEGLLIEENHVREIYPLATVLFFAAGSAELPDRYMRFVDSTDIAGFRDDRIPGGTLEKYRHLLNIIGYRMRLNPKTQITIRGHDSKEPALGETSRISEQRAMIVARYLHSVWRIDPSRTRILPSGGFPAHRSGTADSLTNAENRRVEIRSDDWEIVAPIMQEDFRRVSEPGDMLFLMSNGVSDELVASRRIEITRHGRRWHTITEPGLRDSLSAPYNWGREGNEDSIPVDTARYVATLVVQLKDGRECRSAPLEIPIIIVTNEVKRRERLVEETRDIYSVLLFDYGSDRIGPIGRKILRELIVADIRAGAKIVVTGFAGREPDDLDLSTRRAKGIADIVRTLASANRIASLESAGVGNDAPLYNADLPEGRFYNRTVKVRIVTPTGGAER